MFSSNDRDRRGGDAVYWLIAIGLVVTGIAAPIGILMIVLKLLSGGKRRDSQSGRAQWEQVGPVGARTTATVWEPVPSNSGSPVPRREKAASGAAPKPGSTKAKTGAQAALNAQEGKSRTFIILGAVLTVLFGIALPSALGDVFYWLFDGEITWAVQEFFHAIPILCFLGAGAGCLWAGLRRRKLVRRCRNYLNMVARQKVVSVSALATATGLPPARVREDLADMLDWGVFPKGFLDYGSDRLILSGEGLLEKPAAPREKPAAPEAPAPSPEDAILAEIREVNDIVDNEKLSAQIDRIGVITAKILDYQRSHPDKAPQLHSFLSYYLPTTLKILRAYGQLEDQEVAGENITAAMQRIEGMMDKVVEGFEKQLDLLFQGDAMDLTADVEVLERMLAKDGLSDQGGITLSL